MKISYGTHENIAKNIIFSDGIARSGKSTFANVISSLERTEHIRFYYLLEQVIPAVGLGTLDPAYARSLIRLSMNEMAYDMRLARNANFRHTDQTGIWNYKYPKLYFERLQKEEGDTIVDELRNSNSYTPITSHDLMVNLEFLNLLEIDYHMIEWYRHPVDNIYSWWTRGWGERFLNDPRGFTLSLAYKNQLVPWYCAGYEQEWLSLNPAERCVRIGLDLIGRAVLQQKKASNLERIHTITFEDFVTHPHQELQKICAFLDTAATPSTERYIKEARCPRILDPRARVEKLKEFKNNVRPALYDQLVEFSHQYEHDLYGLKSVL